MSERTAPPFAELAVVERSGFAESAHLGTIVGLRADGSVAVSLGSPDAAMLPRSSVKPWQAIACRDAGLDLDAAQTAISAGSHAGEDAHTDAVRAILRDAGLDESALGCPPDWPADESTRHRLIRDGSDPGAVWMNCSGKHAAMLATCVRNHWPIDTYLDPDHPLQQRIRAAIEQDTGAPVTHVAVDGCGAPLFGTTVLGLARAAQRIVTADQGTHRRAVVDAMRAEPFYVAGTGHPNTELMRRVPGVLSKGGAEGVIIVAAATGESVAMKVIDGSARATTLVAIAVLDALGVDTSAAGDLTEVAVLGGRATVGRIRVADDLARTLDGLR